MNYGVDLSSEIFSQDLERKVGMRPNNVKCVAGTTRFLVSYRDNKELETLISLHSRALQWGVLTVREHWQALDVPGMFKCIRKSL